MLLNAQSSKPLNVRIHPVESRPGFYVAMHKTKFINATFIVCFPDDITGVVAFKTFTEMLEKYYNSTVVIDLQTDNPIKFKSHAIMDFITTKNTKPINKGE